MRRQRLFLHLRWNGGRELERESSILARSMSFDMSRIDLSNRSLAENYLLRSNYLTDDLLSMIQTRAVQILFQRGFFLFFFIFKFHSNSNTTRKRKTFFVPDLRLWIIFLIIFPLEKFLEIKDKKFEDFYISGVSLLLGSSCWTALVRITWWSISSNDESPFNPLPSSLLLQFFHQ